MYILSVSQCEYTQVTLVNTRVTFTPVLPSTHDSSFEAWSNFTAVQQMGQTLQDGIQKADVLLGEWLSTSFGDVFAAKGTQRSALRCNIMAITQRVWWLFTPPPPTTPQPCPLSPPLGWQSPPPPPAHPLLGPLIERLMLSRGSRGMELTGG